MKQPRIDVCVVRVHCALKESNDMLRKCKAQTLNCIVGFANPKWHKP
jgi:hypothetical protein